MNGEDQDEDPSVVSSASKFLYYVYPGDINPHYKLDASFSDQI